MAELGSRLWTRSCSCPAAVRPSPCRRPPASRCGAQPNEQRWGADVLPACWRMHMPRSLAGMSLRSLPLRRSGRRPPAGEGGLLTQVLSSMRTVLPSSVMRHPAQPTLQRATAASGGTLLHVCPVGCCLLGWWTPPCGLLSYPRACRAALVRWLTGPVRVCFGKGAKQMAAEAASSSCASSPSWSSSSCSSS